MTAAENDAEAFTALEALLVVHLEQYDSGVAPTMEDVVSALVDRSTASDIRHAVAGLADRGIVESRWDHDAYIFWCSRWHLPRGLWAQLAGMAGEPPS